MKLDQYLAFHADHICLRVIPDNTQQRQPYPIISNVPPPRLNQLNRLIVAFGCLSDHDHVNRTNTQRYRYARDLRARNQDCNLIKYNAGN